jgi:uncharacterized protein
MTEAKKLRGFAAMDPDKQAEIARKGGRAAHEQGKAHVYDSAEAKRAGAIGGKRVAADKNHMREIGRLGGLAKGRRLREEKGDPEAAD